MTVAARCLVRYNEVLLRRLAGEAFSIYFNYLK